MKTVLLTALCFFALQINAQVYVGENIHNGQNKRSYSVLTIQPSKQVTESLESYLGQLGKVTKPEKNWYRVQKIKNSSISSDLSTVDVVHKSTKNVEKFEFFFLNEANNALSDFELNEGQAEKFVQGFIDQNQKILESKLLEENVSIAEDELKEAKKNLSKIEKSIESNLKDQQKLGKKLDTTPELMTKALSEKEEIITQLYTTDTTVLIDDKAKNDLNKASSKKDKEISKLEKEAKKAETNLSKKENELEKLKKELQEAKAIVRAQEKILIDTKSLANKK